MKSGFAGAIRLARMAMRLIRAMTPTPTSATLWRRKRRQTVLRVGAASSTCGTPAGGTSGSVAATSLGVLHARIEPRVTDVGQQVTEDDQGRDHHEIHHE